MAPARAALVAIAAFFAILATSATAAPQRIVAVGDLHGDYDAWQTIARSAGIIDARGHWAGGRTTLVQLGFTVGIGLLIDTFVVRTMVVPAFAALVGPRLWWPSKVEA